MLFPNLLTKSPKRGTEGIQDSGLTSKNEIENFLPKIGFKGPWTAVSRRKRCLITDNRCSAACKFVIAYCF